MVDVRDILIKASEMTSPDTWCGLKYFDQHDYPPQHLFTSIPLVDFEQALTHRRCLDANIALAAKSLGGIYSDYSDATLHMNQYLYHDHRCTGTVQHNDVCIFNQGLGKSTEAQTALILDLKEDIRKAADWHIITGQ